MRLDLLTALGGDVVLLVPSAVAARQVADLLFSKATERGMTLELVTHDPALAARCARQISMRSGRIEAEPQQVAVPA